MASFIITFCAIAAGLAALTTAAVFGLNVSTREVDEMSNEQVAKALFTFCTAAAFFVVSVALFVVAGWQ